MMMSSILPRLLEIESLHTIRIVYACESGSRAWGFPSADSDYDVRFLYLHPTPWYLSVEQKRDVIEIPEVDKLDISGWDLRKALELFHRSNPPLLEWLGSPVIYLERYGVAARLRELAREYYSPHTCIYHYLHMAQGNYRQYLKGEQVWLKKYFYVLRPILAIQWIELGYGVAPTSFGVLLHRVVAEGELKTEIEKLIVLKREGAELDYGPRVPVISDFIDAELARLEANRAKYQSAPAPYETLDRIFQDALNIVWADQM
jgi:hypothetical protein